MEGIDNALINENNLAIQYQFPVTTKKAMLSALAKLTDNTDIGLFHRIRNMIAAFMEENEKDFLICPGGWHRYIEDIYVDYFDLRHGGKNDVRKQTWRKYKKQRRKR